MTARRWIVYALLLIALAGILVIAKTSEGATLYMPKHRPVPPAQPWMVVIPPRTVQDIERDAADGRHPVSPWEQGLTVYFPDPCSYDLPLLLWLLYGCW